jgi:hypothetical protein
VRCWVAPRDVVPGADWQQSIMDAIASAKAVVLVFTAHTNQSENVKKEVSAAFEAGAMVIPFRIEDVMPEGSLKYVLTGVHWLDAFAPPLEEHVTQLAKTIANLSGHPLPSAPPEPVVAPPSPASEVSPPPTPPQPAPVPPTPRLDLPLIWAGMSRDRKVAVGAVAALVLVLVLVGIGSLKPKHTTNGGADSSTVAASSAASAAAATTTDSSAQTSTTDTAPDRHVRVINETQHVMMHFYASNVEKTSWEEDILGSSVLQPGQSSNINIDDGSGHCLYDFKAVFDDNQSLVRRRVDVCTTRVYRYTE